MTGLPRPKVRAAEHFGQTIQFFSRPSPSAHVHILVILCRDTPSFPPAGIVATSIAIWALETMIRDIDPDQASRTPPPVVVDAVLQSERVGDGRLASLAQLILMEVSEVVTEVVPPPERSLRRPAVTSRIVAAPGAPLVF
jgi:hypothetical protein